MDPGQTERKPSHVRDLFVLMGIWLDRLYLAGFLATLLSVTFGLC